MITTIVMVAVRSDRIRVREFDQIADVVAGQINKLDGVLDTETHVAFRAYSRHDLSAAFDIGFAE